MFLLFPIFFDLFSNNVHTPFYFYSFVFKYIMNNFSNIFDLFCYNQNFTNFHMINFLILLAMVHDLMSDLSLHNKRYCLTVCLKVSKIQIFNEASFEIIPNYNRNVNYLRIFHLIQLYSDIYL